MARLTRFWGTRRSACGSLQVQYFGHVYNDRDVPWHYPWLYFAATVPVGLQILGVLGLVQAWRSRRTDPFLMLLAASIGFFLVLFSTRVPVYDGERLFLVVFPLWAILIGRGFTVAWARLGGPFDVRDVRWLRSGLVAAILAQAYGVVALHPFGLSYYNLLVCGLPGAERLGLELTYWGDAVDRVLLDRLAGAAAPDASAALAPTLYPGQGVVTTTQNLLRRGIHLEDEAASPPGRLGGRLAPDRLLEFRAPQPSDWSSPHRHPLSPGGLAFRRLVLHCGVFAETSTSLWSSRRLSVKYVQNDLNEPCERAV